MVACRRIAYAQGWLVCLAQEWRTCARFPIHHDARGHAGGAEIKRDAEIRRLRAALRASDRALLDWLHSYAETEFAPETVRTSIARIMGAGGTIAYLAKLVKRNREALGK